MPVTRDNAVALATELLAFDVKARTAGTSVIDLLSVLARSTYGVDVRPTAEEIEAAGEPELEALELGPEGAGTLDANTLTGGQGNDTITGGAA